VEIAAIACDHLYIFSAMTSTDPIKAFEKGGDRDISAGPLKNRSCTDVICVFLFLAHLAAYGFVTFLGVKEGKPEKLFKPRDFKGGYCGLEAEWNSGHDLSSQDKMTFMMNVSESVDSTAKQLTCSSAAESALRVIWSKPAEQGKLDEYLCACCKNPGCGSCMGSLDLPDLSNPTAIETTISGKMSELTHAASGDLFSPSSLNGDLFGSIWSEATRFFVEVCTTSCDAMSPDGTRNYTYSPFPDDPLAAAWHTLKTDPGVDKQIADTMASAFTFKALSRSVCPYDARYCVPFPGVQFDEMPGGHCMFELNNDALNAVGSVAADAYRSLGVQNIADGMSETLGSWTGDFMDTLDSFAIVAASAFVIGFIFLILLRFFVGCVVWTSIFVVFLIFVAGGALCHLRHTQCAGVGLLENGQQMVGNVVIAAKHGLNTAAQGRSTTSEAMTGNGADYRGVQWRTRTGKTCQRWDARSPHNHSYNNATYPNAGLENNYCRNPAGASSIWCYSTDPAKTWDLCSPIGVINAQCPQGFEVQNSDMRKALEIIAYVIWSFALLWLLLVCCFRKQIILAVRLNKVAAVFVYNTPTVILVPVIQAIIGIVWCLVWAASAAFLLSQVPEGHVTDRFFSTFADAYGTETTSGKCTASFVNGKVWKYAGDLNSTSDPCSGNMGNTTGISPSCWGCYAPRYVIDWRVAISLFSFLWNNAFLVALGQLIIAGACSTWFFAPREEKCRKGVVRAGVWISFRYHLGTLAFGSLVIAVVQFVRYILMYFERQAAAAKNRVVVLALRVVQCCLYCFEKCLKFLNKNAYIQVALVGTNFCTSAKAAFFLIFRNLARFGAVAMLGSVIYVIGIIFITAGTSVGGYFLLKALHPEVTPILPMVVYVVTSYLVAKLYMNVFGLSVDTILQCFIATEEMGGDSGFVPAQLQGLLPAKE
jgi:hypothetical protein